MPKNNKINNQEKVIMMDNGLPLWEVFLRKKAGLDFKHVGSVHAADGETALENARDLYTRRNEGIALWVVESKNIFAHEDQADSWFEGAKNKVYRHPTFYTIPKEIKYM